MKQVVKLEKRMFNRGFSKYNRVLINDDWCSNADWMIHRSKVNLDRLDKATHQHFEQPKRNLTDSPLTYKNLTDKMVDGVLDQTGDKSIPFYRTKERADVDGRQLVLFKAVDGKERRIQLRYVRYFGLKTLYSKDSEDDSMLWTEDKKFFVMPVKK